MITINILSSPDKDILGEYIYHQDELILGTSHLANLLINDPLFTKAHFSLQVKETGLLCKNLKEGDFYLSNGKKISGTKTHQSGDELTIGTTKLKIINFSKTETNFKEVLKRKYEEIDIMMPEVQDVLTELEKELIRIESQLNVPE